MGRTPSAAKFTVRPDGTIRVGRDLSGEEVIVVHTSPHDADVQDVDVSESVMEFRRDRLELSSPESWTPTAELYRAYSEYCDEHRHNAVRKNVAMKQLHELIPEMGSKQRRVGGEKPRGKTGVSITD